MGHKPTELSTSERRMTMDIELITRHPAWPTYFDIDVLVYSNDWTVADNRRILLLQPNDEARSMTIRIDSITALPDELVFICGKYVSDDLDSPTSEWETYYGVAARHQIEERIRQA
jgi:hypothetical protein